MVRFGVLASALMVSACAAAPDDAPPVLDGSAWALDSAAAGPLAKSGVGSGVTLEFGPDNASGSGGCNEYRASYTFEGGILRFGPVGATKRGCMDGRGEIESAWFGVLAGPLTVSRDGERLQLRDASGTAYTFAPAPPAK